jgi:hypothetical protein
MRISSCKMLQEKEKEKKSLSFSFSMKKGNIQPPAT